MLLKAQHTWGASTSLFSCTRSQTIIRGIYSTRLMTRAILMPSIATPILMGAGIALVTSQHQVGPRRRRVTRITNSSELLVIGGFPKTECRSCINKAELSRHRQGLFLLRNVTWMRCQVLHYKICGWTLNLSNHNPLKRWDT